MVHQRTCERPAVQAISVGVGLGAVVSAWNLVGMYTTISIATWDVVRQVLFLAVLGGVCAVAARATHGGRSWAITALFATLAAVGCAATVLGTYALSTTLATERIKQVPEFIRDYTHHGYTSPASYFADHYWALLELQAFTWVVGVVGLAALGTAFGRVVSNRAFRLNGQPNQPLQPTSGAEIEAK